MSWSANYCPTPVTTYLYAYGQTTGYDDLTDSIELEIFWGDGTSNSFMVDLVDGGGFDYFYSDSLLGGILEHTYLLPGNYTPMIIATGPDGNADTTATLTLIISSTCIAVDGYTYQDNNSNCVFDAGDDTLGYALVQIHDSSGDLIALGYSNQSGYYNFTIPEGLSNLVISATQGGMVTNCPVAGSYTFNSTASTSFDFGLTCPVTSADYFAYHTAMVGIGVPGGYGEMAIFAGAFGCTGAGNATLTLELDPLVSYVSMIDGPAPTSIVGNVLTWDFSPTGYMGYYDGFLVRMITYTDPSAVIGSPSCWDINITGSLPDPDLSNNDEYMCLTVGGPWDPNAKEVIPAGIGAAGEVAPETEFYYTVYFQNTGNAPALNIYVMDTISNQLDMETFEILGSSHLMNPIFTDLNIIRFDFPNINLPDSNANEPMSHGWVRYRIKAKSGLANGTEIENTAHIYFDYNEAIVTNTTLNTINLSLSIEEEKSVRSVFTLYPNPANNQFTVQYNLVQEGTVFLIVSDLTGKVVSTQEVGSQTPGTYTTTVNTAEFTSGLYFCTLLINSEAITKKITVLRN